MEEELDECLKILSGGYEINKRASKLFRKVVALQKSYSSELNAIVKEELAKTMAVPDNEFRGMWIKVLCGVGDISASTSAMAEVLDTEAYQPLAKFVDDEKKNSITRGNDERILCNTFSKITTSTEKSQNRHTKKYMTLEKKIGTGAEPCKDIKKEVKVLEKAIELVESEKVVTEQANAAVIQYGKARVSKFSTELEYVLTQEYRQIETSLGTFQKALIEHEKFVGKMVSDMAHFPAEIKIEQLRSRMRNVGEKVPIFESKLSINWGALEGRLKLLKFRTESGSEENSRQKRALSRDGTDSIELSEDSLFGCGVAATMKVEREVFKKLGDDPIVFTWLLDCVVRFGGLDNEGVFRKSSSHSRVEQYKEIISMGTYDLSNDEDPYLAANILTMWMSSLENPIIPSEAYENCFHFGKSILAISEDVTDLSTFKFCPERHEECLEILYTIPPANFRVLRRLAGYAKLATSEAHVDLTKMNLRAFAILFSPSILRNTSNDLSVIMESITCDTAFTQCALECIIAHELDMAPRIVEPIPVEIN